MLVVCGELIESGFYPRAVDMERILIQPPEPRAWQTMSFRNLEPDWSASIFLEDILRLNQ